MYSWSVDEKKFKKNDPKKYSVWVQIQLINYGLRDQKLDGNILIENWNKIKPYIDPLKASVLEYWLWDKLPQSLPNYKNGSWSWS
jgi:hypothetical protein